jgi:serine/threonine protein kinase
LLELQFVKVGSSQYVAPEVVACDEDGEGFSGKKPDMFALGVMLFTLHFGLPPWSEASDRDPIYRGYQTNPLNLFKRHPGIRNTYKSGQVNEQLVKLILTLLAYKPSDRPESVEDISRHPFFT